MQLFLVVDLINKIRNSVLLEMGGHAAVAIAGKAQRQRFHPVANIGVFFLLRLLGRVVIGTASQPHQSASFLDEVPFSFCQQYAATLFKNSRLQSLLAQQLLELRFSAFST